MDPTFAPPLRKRLRRIDTEIIQRRAMSIFRKPDLFEPACREFFFAIGHVLSAEHPKREHLSGGKLGRKPALEGAAHRFGAKIDVVPLHFVIHPYTHRFHSDSRYSAFAFRLQRTPREIGIAREVTLDFLCNLRAFPVNISVDLLEIR